jgi:hypothetical protein
MENFKELFRAAHEAASTTEELRRKYKSSTIDRDKALLATLPVVSTTTEALQIYKLSGNRVLKWLALDKAVQMLGTELCDLEDVNALPREISTKVSSGHAAWIFDELKRTGVIPPHGRSPDHHWDWFGDLCESFKKEKQRKLCLIGENITSFEHLLEYWNLLPKEIRYHVRDNMLKAITSAEELESVRKKFKESRIWPDHHFFFYERCLHRLKNPS